MQTQSNKGFIKLLITLLIAGAGISSLMFPEQFAKVKDMIFGSGVSQEELMKKVDGLKDSMLQRDAQIQAEI
jgi:hypothetical protein